MTTFLKKIFRKPTAETMQTSQNPYEQLAATPAASQMKIEDLKVGDGAVATAGAQVTVNYTGTLTNGTKFDSSLDSYGGQAPQPFTFTLGAGQVIPGWDQGVAGMKVGGKRRLTIPPALAYGDQAVGTIPANSTLIFEIDLLGVK